MPVRPIGIGRGLAPHSSHTAGHTDQPHHPESDSPLPGEQRAQGACEEHLPRPVPLQRPRQIVVGQGYQGLRERDATARGPVIEQRGEVEPKQLCYRVPSFREMPNQLPPLEYPDRFEVRNVTVNGLTSHRTSASICVTGRGTRLVRGAGAIARTELRVYGWRRRAPSTQPRLGKGS